jgi:hypothetical protein
MPAIKTHRPGSEYGPCVETCAHRDCEASRKDAAITCVVCRQPLGYERYWWMVDGQPEHEQCTRHGEPS